MARAHRLVSTAREEWLGQQVAGLGLSSTTFPGPHQTEVGGYSAPNMLNETGTTPFAAGLPSQKGMVFDEENSSSSRGRAHEFSFSKN